MRLFIMLLFLLSFLRPLIGKEEKTAPIVESKSAEELHADSQVDVGKTSTNKVPERYFRSAFVTALGFPAGINLGLDIDSQRIRFGASGGYWFLGYGFEGHAFYRLMGTDEVGLWIGSTGGYYAQLYDRGSFAGPALEISSEKFFARIWEAHVWLDSRAFDEYNFATQFQLGWRFGKVRSRD